MVAVTKNQLDDWAARLSYLVGYFGGILGEKHQDQVEKLGKIRDEIREAHQMSEDDA